jgi:hypothetical protein
LLPIRNKLLLPIGHNIVKKVLIGTSAPRRIADFRSTRPKFQSTPSVVFLPAGYLSRISRSMIAATFRPVQFFCCSSFRFVLGTFGVEW